MRAELQSLVARALGRPWETLTLSPLSGGFSGGKLWRVATDRGNYVLKVVEAAEVPAYLLEDHPQLLEAEVGFYREVQPMLGGVAPRALLAEPLADGGYILLLPDLSQTHRLLSSNDTLTDDDLAHVVRTFARLHGRSYVALCQSCLPDWVGSDLRNRFKPALIQDALLALSTNPWTKAEAEPIFKSPRLSHLLEQLRTGLNDEPAVLLYQDFWAGNLALPQGEQTEALLFDWQLAAVGPAALDLTDLSLWEVERTPLLAAYAAEFSASGGYPVELDHLREMCYRAYLLRWAAFLPRLASAMRKANGEGRRYTEWMAANFKTCMAALSQALQP